MLGVLYPYAQIVPKCNGYHSCVYILYNTLWRGLTELLILVNRQCEGQIRWDKRGSFSHVFFVSITEVLILMLKQGGVVGKENSVIMLTDWEIVEKKL